MGSKVRDLGTLDRPLLFYGGPYSNWQATRALFDFADGAGIARKARICTGDIAAYCAHPLETAREVMARGGPVVAGNCEAQLAAGADACGCGFEEGSACDILSGGWYPYARTALAGHLDVLEFFAGCPDLAVLRHKGLRVAVIHGGVRDVARFVFQTSPEAVFAQEVSWITDLVGPVDMVVAGHSGLAFQREVAGVQWLNAGAIGMPGHDGASDTAFAVLDNGAADIRRLSYDHRDAARAMVSAGLTQGYEVALQSGFWPSEDVLPMDLRRVAPADGG